MQIDKQSRSRAHLLGVASVHIFVGFLPTVLLLSLLRVSPLSRSLHTYGIFTEYFGCFVGFCIWKGIRATGLSVRSNGANVLPPWIAIVWLALLVAVLTPLYQIGFVATGMVLRLGFGALPRLPQLMLSWWPDPAQVGLPSFFVTILVLEPYIIVSMLLGGIIALLHKGEIKTGR